MHMGIKIKKINNYQIKGTLCINIRVRIMINKICNRNITSTTHFPLNIIIHQSKVILNKMNK